MLLAAGVFAEQLHNEIWVFNQGYWDKDAGLWVEIQKASWEDVILEEDFKDAVKKDVYGFFDSEKLYKEYSLPWKVCTLLSVRLSLFESKCSGYSEALSSTGHLAMVSTCALSSYDVLITLRYREDHHYQDHHEGV